LAKFPEYIFKNCTICTGPGIVFKVDSIGDYPMVKSYTLPLYGFGKVKRTISGTIITGGAFRFLFPYYNNDRSCHLSWTSLDSSGME
jgi:hypothetical protein